MRREMCTRERTEIEYHAEILHIADYFVLILWRVSSDISCGTTINVCVKYEKPDNFSKRLMCQATVFTRVYISHYFITFLQRCYSYIFILC